MSPGSPHQSLYLCPDLSLGAQNPTSCLVGLLHMQTKQQLQRVEAEVSRLHGYIAQLDHASRAKEATIQQLKERLADGVARAERLARRDAEAYARLRGAHLANRGGPPWHPAPDNDQGCCAGLTLEQPVLGALQAAVWACCVG